MTLVVDKNEYSIGIKLAKDPKKKGLVDSHAKKFSKAKLMLCSYK